MDNSLTSILRHPLQCPEGNDSTDKIHIDDHQGATCFDSGLVKLSTSLVWQKLHLLDIKREHKLRVDFKREIKIVA
ncbi:hypothetical protein RCL_jg6338.t1 [Rhizophagus clarus]|uniref:Uncharacterized protein n=1 Tax=Rhizophagus clarus TaxID=94130 RepID=A0A8H3L4Z4_9GLOM|nr:hypothetical protein RCL_jg6338.t1 [Rhizophagus clarus]